MPFARINALALLCRASALLEVSASCASYLHKQDWNVHDPIETDRCTGRFMTLAPAERACTAMVECQAVCIDNGMPCKCVGDGPCEPGAGSLPTFEMRRGEEMTWKGFETYRKQPTACPWGGAFLAVFFLGAGVYVGGGETLGRRQGRRQVPGVPTLIAAHPHCQAWLSVYGLVADGIALTRGRRHKSPTVLRDRPPQHAERQRSPKKRARGEHLSVPLTEDGMEDKRVVGPASAPPASAPSRQNASTGTGATAAGDGGRWVKVPS